MENNLNEWIEKSGYKKGWIAEQLSVSRESLSKWINGKGMPSLRNAFRLAKILDCKVDDLWELEE